MVEAVSSEWEKEGKERGSSWMYWTVDVGVEQVMR